MRTRQANPYVECWQMCQSRLLAGKQHDIYLLTQQKGNRCTHLWQPARTLTLLLTSLAFEVASSPLPGLG
jgi:hypothetical protein